MKTQITIIFLTLIIHQTYADENYIQSTCKNTPNYQLCITTLHANPQSSTANMAGLALIMVDAVKSKSEQALATVNSLLKTQPKLSQPLHGCANFYNAVLKDDVPMAVATLQKGDPKFAEQAMSDAVVEAELCDRAFKGVAVPPSLSGVDKDVKDLAVVARAIIRNLLYGKI